MPHDDDFEDGQLAYVTVPEVRCLREDFAKLRECLRALQYRVEALEVKPIPPPKSKEKSLKR